MEDNLNNAGTQQERVQRIADYLSSGNRDAAFCSLQTEYINSVQASPAHGEQNFYRFVEELGQLTNTDARRDNDLRVIVAPNQKIGRIEVSGGMPILGGLGLQREVIFDRHHPALSTAKDLPSLEIR